MKHFKDRLTGIKAMVFDVDGVFTATIFVDDNGVYSRSINIKDSYAIQHAVKKGIAIGIITGTSSKAVMHRFEALGVEDIYLGACSKTDAFNSFLNKHNLMESEVLYMGDDLPDYPIMTRVGIAVCPSDAAPEIIEVAHCISGKKGGEGCVRDIVVQVLKAQKIWFDQDSFSW